MNPVRPKKRLGQHFLLDQNIARKIVDCLEAKDTDIILEIGPGMGILTRYLLDKKGYTTYAVEIDRESVDYLRQTCPDLIPRIIPSDFLNLSLQGYFTKPLAIIGNLPYNISSQIFFRIIEQRDMVQEVVCMIQKEVAERIASPSGNKDYGILSVLLQSFYDIKKICNVKPGVFKPPPKVESAVLRLTRNDRKSLGCDETLFIKIVKTTFNQRRKTIKNPLKSIFLTLPSDHEFFHKRPEQLNVDDFIQLTCDLQPYYKEE